MWTPTRHSSRGIHSNSTCRGAWCQTSTSSISSTNIITINSSNNITSSSNSSITSNSNSNNSSSNSNIGLGGANWAVLIRALRRSRRLCSPRLSTQGTLVSSEFVCFCGNVDENGGIRRVVFRIRALWFCRFIIDFSWNLNAAWNVGGGIKKIMVWICILDLFYCLRNIDLLWLCYCGGRVDYGAVAVVSFECGIRPLLWYG